MAPPRVERIAFTESDSGREAELFAQCREIRRRVFVQEQSVPEELEWDGCDELAEHFAAFTEGGPEALVRGTARLRTLGDVAKAERVAVLPAARDAGVGRSLMAALEARVRERSLRLIRLDAQVAVVPFYERLGYRGEGDVFLEAGIEHLAMSKSIG